jgi:hypothetical protein
VVRQGDQSWDEMMIGFFDVAIDPQMEPGKLIPKKSNSGPAPAL